jgi:hypothetical protein
MAFDDLKLPRASLRGERLYVEGEKEPYFRDPRHTIELRVSSLTIHREYRPEDFPELTGKKVLTESLHGIAKPEGRDSFAVIGLKTDGKTPIEFQLRPISDDETKFHWRTTIGFRPLDWEYSQEECFWVQAYCTREYFDDVLAAVRRGNVDYIRLGMQTTMWTRDKASMIDVPRSSHLAPRRRRNLLDIQTRTRRHLRADLGRKVRRPPYQGSR